MNLAIVGAGPAGLCAALAAADAGHEVTVLERSPRLGGMAASIVVSSQRVDLGSHRLHPSAPADVMALLQRLLGEDLQTRTRNGRIRIGGQWVRFPLSFTDLARRLPPRFIASAAIDTLASPLRRERRDTYDEVIRAGLGPAVLDWFYGPYATKLWGCDASQLHGDVARRRVAVTSPAKMVMKLIRAAAGPPVFLYPRLGYGQVIDALELEARAAGVTIITGADVSRVEPAHGSARARIRWSETGPDDHDTSSTRTLEADRIFWTASPNHLIDVVDNAPTIEAPPTVRAMVLVFVTFDCDQYSPFDAHYFPEVDVLPARISEPKNYRDGDDPHGRTVLCAEIACDIGDATWNADPRDLADHVIDTLESTGVRSATLPQPKLLDVHLERLPSVYPVIKPSNVDSLRTLHEWAVGLEGITVFGRQGLVVADNLHHVLDMGLAAARCLGTPGDNAWDEPAWSEALARFEQNVVED